MKKFSFIILTVAICGTASATTKCVPFNSATTCTYTTLISNVTNWETTCTTNGNSFDIQIVSSCSSTTGLQYSATDTLGTSSSATNCWCKMTVPAVSKWISMSSFSSAGNCLYGCINDCAKMINNASYKRAFYSNFIN